MKYKWGTKVWHDSKVWIITEVDSDKDTQFQYQIADKERTLWVKEQDLINTKTL